MLRLFELIRDTPFGLEVISSNTSTNRRIAGGHVVEMPDPGRWLASDYLALTTGVALKGVARQERFVASVHEAGSAALAFGVGINFQHVPRAVVQAGERLGLPIVSVPLEVPFREVLTYISRSTLATGFQDFSRALRLQDYLLAALEDPDPEASLAKRLGELVRGSVAIFRPDGRLAASAGRPPVPEMWAAICEGTDVARVARNRLLSAEARLAGNVRYRLAASIRNDDRSEAFAAEVLQFGARVAQAIAAASKIALTQERAARASLLMGLLSSPTIPRDVLGRAKAFSLDEQAPTALLVAQPWIGATARKHSGQQSGDSESIAGTAVACEEIFHTFHLPYLSGSFRGRAVAIWQDGIDRAPLVDALKAMATARGVSVGLSRPAADMSGLEHAFVEAGVALLEAERLAEPAMVGYEDLALSDLVLTRSPPEVTARAQSMLDPLRRERPEMLHTLVEYLEHDCDVMLCAKHLYLHPNTVRYRLSRIESSLGQSLRSVATLADLYLALRLNVSARASDGSVDEVSPRQLPARALG
jgi:purine catabolism regulator